MARRFTGGVLALLVSGAAFGAISVGAATQFGGGCDPTSSGRSATMVLQLSRSTPPSTVKTTSPGVVTAWSVQSGAWLDPATMALKIARQDGSKYEVVAASEPVTVQDRPDNQFATRIPVGAGVLFGVSSSGSIPMCENAIPGDSSAFFNADVPVGSKGDPSETDTGTLLSLAVVIEPDADGDGFGDETQDKCPSSAATQGACPAPPGGGGAGAAVTLKGKPKLEGNVVAVKLTTTAQTAVTVTGTIRGKQAASPASKTVSPGETGRLYLTLKKSVKQRLAKLPRKRKLKMVIEAKVDGAPTVSTEISLPGRKRPQPARAPR